VAVVNLITLVYSLIAFYNRHIWAVFESLKVPKSD